MELSKDGQSIPEGYGELMDFTEHTEHYSQINLRIDELQLLLQSESIWKRTLKSFSVATATILVIILFSSVIVATQSENIERLINPSVYVVEQ